MNPLAGQGRIVTAEPIDGKHEPGGVGLIGDIPDGDERVLDQRRNDRQILDIEGAQTQRCRPVCHPSPFTLSIAAPQAASLSSTRS